MNATPSDDLVDDLDQELGAALISHCQLAPEDVDRIRETMRAMHLSFADAALHVGLVSEHDIEDVTAWVRRLASGRNSSLVEAALQRRSVARRVTVHQGEQVRAGRKLILAHDLEHPRSEKLRALRTELLMLNERSSHASVFALLSAQPGEGRSQLAAELAISFAQLGRRTLLVDADLRHPSQHTLFEADNLWGLAQSLAHGEPPCLHGVENFPDLSLLTAGTLPPNPLEVLSHGRFEQMLAEWRYNYEFIVIDTPAVGKYADALAVATLARRVLLLSRAQQARFKDMKEMLRRLATTQSQVVGAVINHF